jgi:hypothetical protein
MRNKPRVKPASSQEFGATPLVSRRAFMGYGAAGGVLGLLGCTPAAEPLPTGMSAATPHHRPDTTAPAHLPQTAEPVAPPPEQMPGALPSGLNAWLTASAVLSQRPHALSVRTWTTPAQAREIERGDVLTRSHAADLSRSFFDQILARRRATDSVARLLESAPLSRSRYAWPHAWATAHGLHGVSYGTVLATLHLRADVLWLGYSAAAPDTWTLHDASGTALEGVDPRDVASRIAGVFFQATPLAAPPYRARNMELPEWGPWGMREYIVRNPDAIASVTVDDAGERQTHTANLAQLEALGAFVANLAATPRFGEFAARAWQTLPAPGESWRVSFARALAITTPTYASTSAGLATLATTPSMRRRAPQPIPLPPSHDRGPFSFGMS